MRHSPIFIPVGTARDMVKPYKLRDILISLRSMGLIQSFKIGPFLVRIESKNQRRFELASYMGETTDFQAFKQNPKKLG